MSRGLQLVAGTLVVVAVLALTVGLKLRSAPEVRQVLPREPAVLAATVAAPARPDVQSRIEKLPCFSCHDVEEYWKGEKFPHRRHAREVGVHCHLCHAFEGHFQVVTRRDLCADCHDDG